MEDRRPFPCTFEACEYRAAQKKDLQCHVESKHTATRSKKYQCTLCPSKFYWLENLKAHIGSHTNEKRFACSSCNYRTNSSPCLSQHVKTQHGPTTSKKYCCTAENCRYSTAQHGPFKLHVQSHNPDPLARRPFPCDFLNCDYRAASAKGIERHAVRHDGSRIRQFSCPLCPKSYYHKEGRRVHIRVAHTKEKPYKCAQCKYGAIYASQLKVHCDAEHRREEIRAQKYTCKFCAYIGNNLDDLESHVRKVHPKERLYSCGYGSHSCNFKTNYFRALRQHMLIHGETGHSSKVGGLLSRSNAARHTELLEGPVAELRKVPVVLVQKINLLIV